jgi:hypothetical protein
VFIAGHRMVGVEGESARRRDVYTLISTGGSDERWERTARLSHIPPAIFASISAEQGATTTRSAHLRS